jgi:hypothetical protein
MSEFKGLTSAFNFDQEVENVEKDIQQIEEKKNEIAQVVHSPAIIQDQNFIQDELKALIMSANVVKAKVEKDIKIGAKDRTIEVYAKLVESIGKQITSLAELNKDVFKLALESGQADITNIGNNKISMTSDQLLDMIEAAKDRSEMNKIDAEFEIKDEYMPKSKNDRGKDGN